MNKIEYNDIVAFHPGYYLAETIEDMGITQCEFAARMGTTPKTLSKLLAGQANLSPEMARNLSIMLGTSEDLWMNIQNEYEKKLLDIAAKKDIDAQVEIVTLIDYSYFVKVAGLESTRNAEEKVANLCQYLIVSDLRVFRKTDFLINYKTGTSNFTEKNALNARVWVQTAMNFAKNIKTKKFDAKKLSSYLPEIRNMTVLNPSEFVPRLREIFADCGVAFVLLPYLKNSGINGVVKWIGQEKVMLALNDRRCYADTFWFALFHEIKHILQQKVKTSFLSLSIEDMGIVNDELESEANRFASDYLIPPIELKRFAPTKYTSDSDIKSFAKKIGIHPGIVVGRLQHDKIIGPERCSSMKEKYHIIAG